MGMCPSGKLGRGGGGLLKPRPGFPFSEPLANLTKFENILFVKKIHLLCYANANVYEYATRITYIG